MPRSTQRHGFDVVTRTFHWLTAAGILAALALGLAMVRLPAGTELDVARAFRLYSLHKTLGVSLLGLAALRALWRLSHRSPGPLHPERRIEVFAARVTHAALWIALFALPVSGLLHHAAAPGFAPILWPFGQSLPFVPADERLALVFRSCHASAGWVLIGALCLHAAGALKHQILDRDSTLARIVTGGGPATMPPRAAPHAAILAAAIWGVTLFIAILMAPLPEPDPFDAIDPVAFPTDTVPPAD